MLCWSLTTHSISVAMIVKMLLPLKNFSTLFPLFLLSFSLPSFFHNFFPASIPKSCKRQNYVQKRAYLNVNIYRWKDRENERVEPRRMRERHSEESKKKNLCFIKCLRFFLLTLFGFHFFVLHLSLVYLWWWGGSSKKKKSMKIVMNFKSWRFYGMEVNYFKQQFQQL